MKTADSLSSHRNGHEHAHRHHHGSHSHSHHDHDHDLRRASRRSLKTALVLIASFMVVEVVGGVLSGSLSLLADAGHMLTDAASIVLALVALHFSDLPASWERTYGYRRLEVLAALINALSLCVIIGGVLWEAYRRLRTVPEVEGGLMLGIGLAGLAVNVLAMLVLRKSAEGNLNVEGALQHIVADLLGSVAVVVSGALVWAFGWTIVDPILSVVISLLIGISAWRLLAKVFNVLLQGVPKHVDLYQLVRRAGKSPGSDVRARCARVVAGLGLRCPHRAHPGGSRPANRGLDAHARPGAGTRETRLQPAPRHSTAGIHNGRVPRRGTSLRPPPSVEAGRGSRLTNWAGRSL